MKKKYLWLIAFLVLVIIAVIIYFASNGEGKQAAAVEKQQQQPTVDAIIIKPSELSDKFLTNGTLLSDEEVELHPEISGRITGIYFKEGSPVKKGDLLVKINDADLQAQLEKLSLKKELSAKSLERQKILFEKEGISKESYDIAINDYKTCEADISNIKAQIEKTEIKSPFDAVAGLRYVSEGAYLTPSTKIAALQSLNRIKIEFSLPQKYLPFISAGKEIEFALPSTAKKYSAKIYAIEPKIDPESRTINVRAIYNNESRELKPGLFIEVNFSLDNNKDAVLIPSAALTPDIQGVKVFVFSNGRAIQKYVQTGFRSEDKVQIISGLGFGDTLISSGIIMMKQGLPVKLGKVE